MFLPVQDLMAKYRSKFAIVTGGTDGIGLSIVKKLAKQGFSIYVIGLDTKKVMIDDLPSGSVIDNSDLSSAESGIRICKWIEECKPSFLVHAAGLCIPSKFDMIDEPNKYIDAYISSMVQITQTFLKYRKREGGIVFFSSQVALWSNPFASLYAATKAFTHQFARSIAIENPNIETLVISPGAVNGTSFFRHFPYYWYFYLIRLIGQDCETVSNLVFKSLGKVSSVDTGILTYVTRIMSGLVDSNIIDKLASIAAKPLQKYFN